MYLTREEERIYDGEMGWAYQVSMRILVKLGELYGASRLIPIESAHISGVSYKTVGDAAIEFLRALSESNGRVKVRATINPSGVDQDRILSNILPSDLVNRQMEIVRLYEEIGATLTLTCTPYYIETPKSGAHISWAESSAVIYANSIIGSWTNREGGPSALASALIGKTPDYGLHRPENRQPSVLVKVEAKLNSEADYGALGLYLGRILGEKIPLIQGLSGAGETDLKQMGAAMATSGMVPMFHIDRIGRSAGGIEKITVDERDIIKTRLDLSTSSGRPDLVFIGCPHCSPNEIRLVSELIRGRRVRSDVRLWICTSNFIREKMREHARIIESAGGRVMCGTCAVVTWLKNLGVETIMTNSAKTAYYARLLDGVGVIFAPISECINVACQ
ncbi:MAG: aconitase X catalytic domain-containing protein [Candidatus Bathyarchaeia archaeon]